ncbi:MAG: hypothetical protein HGA54_08315, partial [Actinobacteria bacterium]|nr:hypothetical protein [Actinomycetota bacterium]
MKWFSNIRTALMTRSWRFWVVSGYVVIVAVFCSVWIWSLLGPLNEAVVDEQTKSLTAIVQIDALYLSETTQDVGVAAKNLVADTDLRATIIALDGTVLGDSSQNISTLENHLDRPEVQSALAGSAGSDVRTSESDGVPRLYVAVPASYRGEDVIMRISEPLTDLTSIGTTMRNSGLVLLGLGILIAALVAWRTYKSAARPVNRLEQVRSDFVAGASHELKTPVAGIRLLSDAITSASDDGDLETTKMFAARLDTEAQRLQHLVT